MAGNESGSGKKIDRGSTPTEAVGAMTNESPGARKKEPVEVLQSVTELAAAAAIKPWELAGLMRAAGWAEGKYLAPSVFAKALAAFRTRRQGGGGIVA